MFTECGKKIPKGFKIKIIMLRKTNLTITIKKKLIKVYFMSKLFEIEVYSVVGQNKHYS